MRNKKHLKIFSIILIIAIICTSFLVKPQAADDAELGVNLEEAFKNWTPISRYKDGELEFPGKWSYNSAGYIVNSENTSNMTGFYNPTTNYEDIDITVKMGSWNSDDDTLGCMIRFSEDANHNCYGYIFAYDCADTSGGGALHGGLYKISGKQFHTSNLTKLVDFSTTRWVRGEYDTVRLTAEGSVIKVWIDNKLIATYTDSNPIKSGSYGFFSYSQPDARFAEIKGTAILAKYTATFDANGGTLNGSATKTVTSTKTYGELPTATKDGYTFAGWYTSKTGGTKITADSTVDIAANTTFYARWTPIQYDVTCIDMIKGTSIILGQGTYKAGYETTTYGSAKGSSTTTGAYYPEYKYDSCSSAKVAKTNTIVYRYFTLDTFSLTAKAQNTDNNNKGSVLLDWSSITGDNKIFKGYQSKDGGKTWNSISLTDYTSTKEIKVLNIYPTVSETITFTSAVDNKTYTLPKSASLKMWMEKANSEHALGYGKGIIKVTPVTVAEFNANPSMIYNYDVTMLGTWDTNSGQHPDANALTYIEDYIKKGYGFISGHDTIGYTLGNKIGMSTLRDYFDIKIGVWNSSTNGHDYNVQWGYSSTQVKIVQPSLFTTYPWNIGEVGTILTVPSTHTTSNSTKGQVLLELVNGSYNSGQQPAELQNAGYNDRYYLTVTNNRAMIQTGHSNCSATADEQKILANLLFYEYQLSSATSVVDYSAMDIAKPTKPSITVSGTTYKFASTDTGSQYQYKIEAYHKENMSVLLNTSDPATATVTTNLKEYRYLFDNNANTVMTATSGTSVATTTAQITNASNAADYKYLHVIAVDKAGNVSETQTIDLKRTVTVKHYQLTITGTKPSTPFATETYQVVANISFTAPVNSYTGFTTPTKKTITVGDSTTVEYLYERINYQNKFKHILTGVNYNFVTTIGEAVYGQEYSVDTSYSVTAPKGTVLRNTFASDYSGTKTNYTLGSTFTQPAKVLNNEMYYDPIKYTITYHLDGGTNNSSNPSTYTVVDNISFQAPTKKGYDFMGWYTDANFTKPITGVNEGTNNNFTSAEDMHNKLNSRKTGAITLYAKFVIHDYKITTNIKSGVGVVSDTSKVEYLTNTAVLITAGNGHRISKVEVDGVEINFNQGSQTLIKEFSNVEADHVVNVWFEAEDSWKSELDTYHKYEWIDLKFN